MKERVRTTIAALRQGIYLSLRLGDNDCYFLLSTTLYTVVAHIHIVER